MAEDGLAFFNSLSGTLRIELSEEPRRATPKLENLIAPPKATLVSLTLNLEYSDRDADTFRPLTDDEWERVALARPRVSLSSSCGPDGLVVHHDAPNGTSFTVRTLAAAVEETERRARGSSEWLGGIDVHHRFFEGLHERGDRFEIAWGS